MRRIPISVERWVYCLAPPFSMGNRFEVLLNGDEIFPAMLCAIRAAEETITFESYIY
jgi:cardiolipin synthase